MNAIFITCRSKSTRLPNKILLPLGATTVLDFIIRRCFYSTMIDKIVVCTTTDESDDKIEEAANLWNKQGVSVFRGSTDRIDRWLKAMEKFDIEYFVNFDGDDVFCDPDLINLASYILESYKEFEVIKSPIGIPIGAFSYAFSRTAIQKMYDKRTTEHEILDPLIDGLVSAQLPSWGNYKSNIRLTLDYPEDYEFFKKAVDIGVRPWSSIDEIIRRVIHANIQDTNLFRNKDWKNNQLNQVKEQA